MPDTVEEVDDWPWGDPDGWTRLDADHLIRLTTDEAGRPYAYLEAHRRDDRQWCVGLIQRGDAHEDARAPGAPSWDVLSEEPLTLSPSLLCRVCGSHGFVSDGHWVPA